MYLTQNGYRAEVLVERDVAAITAIRTNDELNGSWRIDISRTLAAIQPNVARLVRVMFSDALSFYWSCLKRAFSGWFKRVEGWAGTVSLAIAVVLLFVQPSAVVGTLAQAAPAWFFVGVFGLLVGGRILLSPYLLFRDERSVREDLERARQPNLEVSLPTPPVIQSIDLRGHTSESLAGSRQTVVTGWEMDVVALECVNRGELVAKGCRARLLSVSRHVAEGNEMLRVTNPVALAWDKDDPESNLVVDLAPAELRRIWIGGVRTHGHVWLFRQVDKLPLEYQRLLGEAGIYRLIIQIDGDGVAPQQVELEIVASEGPKPTSGIWRGRAQVTIVAQGAPRIGSRP